MKKMTKAIAAALSLTMLVGAGASAEGTLVFGTNPEFPPFEYVVAEGVIDIYDGIDIAIAKQIGDDNDMEVEIANYEFDSLLIALQNGQIDAVIAGMTVTEERAESVNFSTPYYTATQVMIVPEDSEITCAADMEGKTICVIQGYTGETCVQELGYEYESFKKGSEAIMELVNGKCDVVVIDSATAEKYVGDNEGLKIVEDEDAFGAEEYAIAVAKDNDELLETINASIEKMLEDGTIAALSAEYMDADTEEETEVETEAVTE
ncbi:MAG: transporter substrate-binding domain-containing protein [Lachnospiraceae bacterium]|nr:transporter substrate-binding domain-containing protein [Lachnospiraceae bacterium]